MFDYYAVVVSEFTQGSRDQNVLLILLWMIDILHYLTLNSGSSGMFLIIGSLQGFLYHQPYACSWACAALFRMCVDAQVCHQQWMLTWLARRVSPSRGRETERKFRPPAINEAQHRVHSGTKTPLLLIGERSKLAGG